MLGVGFSLGGGAPGPAKASEAGGGGGVDAGAAAAASAAYPTAMNAAMGSGLSYTGMGAQGPNIAAQAVGQAGMGAGAMAANVAGKAAWALKAAEVGYSGYGDAQRRAAMEGRTLQKANTGDYIKGALTGFTGQKDKGLDVYPYLLTDFYQGGILDIADMALGTKMKQGVTDAVANNPWLRTGLSSIMGLPSTFWTWM